MVPIRLHVFGSEARGRPEILEFSVPATLTLAELAYRVSRASWAPPGTEALIRNQEQALTGFDVVETVWPDATGHRNLEVRFVPFVSTSPDVAKLRRKRGDSYDETRRPLF